MRVIKADIWDYWKRGYFVIIPTNGTVKKNGEAVMGRGLALQAKERFPDLPRELATWLKKYGNRCFTSEGYRLITFPVKYHWKGKADLDLIRQSVKDLVKSVNSMDMERVYDDWLKVAIPKVGCGNGGLDWKKDVEPVLDQWLDSRFIVIDLK